MKNSIWNLAFIIGMLSTFYLIRGYAIILAGLNWNGYVVIGLLTVLLILCALSIAQTLRVIDKNF